MKCIAFAASLVILAPFGASAQTTDQLVKGATDTAERAHLRHGLQQPALQPAQADQHQERRQLVPVWAYSLNNTQSHESQPIVHDGVMYVTTHDATVAINPLTGKQIWKTPVELPQDVFKYACCGILNRGVARLQRQGVPHHARRARGRARRQDRQADLEEQGRRLSGRLFA